MTGNNIGVMVRFYYDKSMNPLTFFGIKNIEYKGDVICDLTDMISEQDKSGIDEDWTYVPLHVIDDSMSEEEFVELIKKQDTDMIFKLSEYIETEFTDKQMSVYEGEDDFECCENDCETIKNHSCGGGCSHCSGCSFH